MVANSRPRQEQVRGWTVLSDQREAVLETIRRGARKYDINQIQLSHEILMDLREIRDESTRELVADLTESAREESIDEVAIWDHSLYDKEYYPDRFKTKNGEIDFDDPGFWEWFRTDYQAMLERCPDIDALILTFIETGAKIRDQYSTELSESEMIAMVVNTIADVCGEYEIVLYARTFAYSDEAYGVITGAVEGFDHDNINLMMKEAPHDFHLPHPQNPNPSQFDRDTLVEFDVAGEFHGQGIVQNTFPEHFLNRVSATSQEGYPGLLERENVMGYCARMDRWGDTQIIDTPAEINAMALDMYVANPDTKASGVYETFIADRYGGDAIPSLRPAFENGLDIALGTFYTLNTNTADHSRLNYDPYKSSYARHVSGRWLEPPKTYVPRGVNREFHYWKEIAYRLAPNWAKAGGAQLEELTAQEIEWMGTAERMNEEYLRYVLTEKDHCLKLTRENLQHLADARPHLTAEQYDELDQYFSNTKQCLELRRATAAAYWGFRVWARGEGHRSKYVIDTLDMALEKLLPLADKIEAISSTPTAGQWDLTEDDPRMARQYHAWITDEGWPDEVAGERVSFGGVKYSNI